ncbi:hypothetical protein JYB62_03990 [Algoriphagus lutimaris]|uniref:hypothetical protein n=1 Tax=Algoriphagus lutimaris TaxID=613197 RepID=UPI00196AE26E|nr:hypothetical protein [Algoriphagus lutimaris]MBN3519154.1 hypothetical protein [Algoriphagus lutimaris]
MKNSMWSKLGLMSLAGSMFVSACTSVEEPALVQPASQTEVLTSPETLTDGNARKRVERNYFERFTNQLFAVPINEDPSLPFPAYFPGSGEGNSSHMGKAYTFLNQYAFFGPDGLQTIGAPVTQYFAEELENMGIFVDNDEVSSITTDGKGNSVWFKNINNVVTPVSDERSEFIAEVEIIGGTGKFEGATGEGTVVGNFNPQTGAGSSTIQGRIEF